jgi:hypothetical protein
VARLNVKVKVLSIVHVGPPKVTIGETTRVSWDEWFWHQANRKRLKFNDTLKNLERRGGDSHANL